MLLSRPLTVSVSFCQQTKQSPKEYFLSLKEKDGRASGRIDKSGVLMRNGLSSVAESLLITNDDCWCHTSNLRRHRAPPTTAWEMNT
ncbi:hypothetical protein TNCT_195581 [Trichonephila clavata]|uniref:Uncharacterized protein n=2 Tax=Trichonephila TaxID=2585208 RepID=A0A8X6H1X0_TRICU|nr:hypothetical protein TNCT_195581 [Trichonephila clavata]GFS30473.1 hypothetical protein TNIN_407361 [Trichonephila inaurata madagascariensis]